MVVGSHTETVEDPAWDETVHHEAEYRYWDETLSICSTCGADITGHAGEHLQETGHAGYYSQTVNHQDLVREAYTEVVHHPASSHTETVNELAIQIYCSDCGLVYSTEPFALN